MANDRLLKRLLGHPVLRANASRAVGGVVTHLLNRPARREEPKAGGVEIAETGKPDAAARPEAAGGEASSLPRRIAHTALLRIATRSVPGAIVVGGSLLARHLYLSRKARIARDAAAPRKGK